MNSTSPYSKKLIDSKVISLNFLFKKVANNELSTPPEKAKHEPAPTGIKVSYICFMNCS
jgi:hypothetical protein